MKAKPRRNSRLQRQTNSRRRTEMRYDRLEPRQLLAIGTGIVETGAESIDAEITSLVPNAEGDIGPNHLVEVGDQTYTVFNRDGDIVQSKTLNQFFDDAGGNRFGDDLQSPRILFDRATDRWFLIAVGAGEGDFAGNRIHLAFSQNADPTGQWQQLDFVADVSGVLVHDNVTLGVDADGVYFATQNFNGDELDSVSIYSIPKIDIFAPNPTLNRISRFENLSIFEYGVYIQFANNFEASDGTVFGFSAVTIDANAGTGLDPDPVLAPATLNSFQITGATGANATLTTPVDVVVDTGSAGVPFVEPLPINQLNEDGQSSTALAEVGGLRSSLIEQNGSVFGAQTVGLGFVEGTANIRTTGVNWFQLDVAPGTDPIVHESPLRGPVSHVFLDANFIGDVIPDPPELDEDPAVPTPEFIGVSFFNPAFAASESGLFVLTFNGVDSFDLFGATAAPTDPIGISTFASVGIMVNGAQTDVDGDGNPIFGRNAIQMENPAFIRGSASSATGPFVKGPVPVAWGEYSSVRVDPTDPANFFSVIPVQSGNNNEWEVEVTEIIPVELRPVVELTENDDVIVIRVDQFDPDLVTIEINGVVTDQFERSRISQIVVAGFAGDDHFIVDHVNGDPTPNDGFVFIGGTGFDMIETRSPEDTEFIVDAGTVQNAFYPGYLVGPLEASDPAGLADMLADQDGTFISTTANGVDLPIFDRIESRFIDFEELIGGDGNDTFRFLTGPLAGSAEGRGGDDRFEFVGDTRINGSINGGTGFNTLDLQERAADTDIRIFSVAQNLGFNGRTVDGPIGQFNQILDQFRDISLIRGSQLNAVDSLQVLNQLQATVTIVATDIDPDSTPSPGDANSFAASSYEAGGQTLFFTQLDIVSGSVLNDVFNVQSNNAAELPTILLNGRAGDDIYNVSSDAPNNTGVLAGVGGVIEVNGGIGDNQLNVSDVARQGPDEFLIVSQRISGPVEVIYRAEDEDTMKLGTMEVSVFGSDSDGPDTFFLQSFDQNNTLNVFGNGGDDTFVIQDLSQATVELFGGEGDDLYIIEQVAGIDNRNVTIFDSVNAERDRALIVGTFLDESFVIDTDTFTTDQFTFIGIEEFGIDGRGGDDQFFIRGISSDLDVSILGGDGDDIFFVSSDAPTNLGDLTGLETDFIIDGGTGTNQLIISNESGEALDVVVTQDRLLGLFDGILFYRSTGGIFDEVSITGSNGGDDRFVIAGFLDQNSLRINGRLGEDEFQIGANNAGEIGGSIVLDGGSDGDTYTFLLAESEDATVTIDDTGFSGLDTLSIRGTVNADSIDIDGSSVDTAFQSIAITPQIEILMVEGFDGDDIISVDGPPVQQLTLVGNSGNDSISVSAGAGLTDLTVFGSDGNDTISILDSAAGTAIEVFAGAGADNITLDSNVLGDALLQGQQGNDTFIVNLVESGARSVVIGDPNSDSEFNRATVSGGASENNFRVDLTSVMSGGESVIFNVSLDDLTVAGRGGADTFNLVSTLIPLTLNGGGGNDVFNLSSLAPANGGTTAGIVGDVSIDGGAGNNRLRVDNAGGTSGSVVVTSETISGMAPGLITFSSDGGQFARGDGVIGGITLIGSAAGETFDVRSLDADDTLRIEGRNGDDSFLIGNLIAGDVLFDGGQGSDSYRFQFGATSARRVVIADTGTTGTDLLELIASDGNDNIAISADMISDGISTLQFNVPLNEIEIFGLGGNDRFTINGSFTTTVTLHGDTGDDTFIVNNSAGVTRINLFGGTGDDSFEFNQSADITRIVADGAAGDDTFQVGRGASGTLLLDGQSGSDTYNVSFAGQGQRRIDTRDSGIGGNDRTHAFGTGGSDRIAVRTARLLYDDEAVIFDQNTERVTVESGAGDDRLVMFGSRSPLTEVFAGAGNDNFVVNGGSRADLIKLHGDQGDDVFLVRKTTVDTVTNLRGGEGDDRFNIGSTANQDDGNFGRIRGELNINGGSNSSSGEDQILANDNGVSAAFSYVVSPTSIRALTGPGETDRSIFAGINFGPTVEFVRLDGTPLANLFQVTASNSTRFFIDGNAPTSASADRLRVVGQPNDGRELFVTSGSQGAGFVSFTNGNQLIQFDNIESRELVGGSTNFSFAGELDDEELNWKDDWFASAESLTEIDDLILL